MLSSWGRKGAGDSYKLAEIMEFKKSYEIRKMKNARDNNVIIDSGSARDSYNAVV